MLGRHHEPDDHPRHRRASWWRRLLIRVALAVYLVTLGPLVCFAARWWWVFDLASHFRLQYVWGLTAVTTVLATLRMWELASVAGLLLLEHVAAVVPFYAPRRSKTEKNHALRLVSINLWNRNGQFERALDFVRREAPDIAVFLEVTDAWESALDGLRDRCPFSYTHAPGTNRGIAIHSRLRFDDLQVTLLTDADPAIIVRVTIDGTSLTIVAAHPLPPMSRSMSAARDMQLRELAEQLAGMTEPRILIGDLNTTSWSPAFADLIRQTGLRDSRQGLGVQPSWPSFLPRAFRIPLDHCLVSAETHVVDRRIGPNVGSDHLPIVIDVSVSGTSFPVP